MTQPHGMGVIFKIFQLQPAPANIALSPSSVISEPAAGTPKRHDDVDFRDNIAKASGSPTTTGRRSLCGSLKKLRS